MKKTIVFIFFTFLFSSIFSQQSNLDLSGLWQFKIDRNDIGENEKWFNQSFNETILLPGSMPERLKGDDVTINTQWTGSLYDSSFYFNPDLEKFRQPENIKFPFFLTPDKHYVGIAWYGKEFELPKSWKNQKVKLYLERPHIETTLWINGKQVDTQNSLCVPHVFDISNYVKSGKNKIALKVDNRIKDINVGPDSHSITDQTQGNWNGIVGKIELQKTTDVYIDDVQVYPDIHKKEALVKIVVSSPKTPGNIDVLLSSESFNSATKHIPEKQTGKFKLSGDTDTIEMFLPMGNDMLLWDEFDPNLYNLHVQIKQGEKVDSRTVNFGMREFSIDGRWFYVNGRKTILRGTVENCCFPLTGYAPMDQKSWERVFRICKDFGLNHVRFHSFCPPEAAFIAADIVGIYLQPEGPSWPNHGPKLGMGQPIDKYLMEETIRLNKEYGNYASFCMLACGNEPSGRWVPWVTDFVEYWKNTDPRHVYTGASVGGGWAWQPNNQYHVKAGVRGLNWNNTRPESMSDFREKLDTVRQPFVSHETGQWCVFPDFNEIRKYTGVNKAGNFEIFKYILEKNGMSDLSNEFMLSSGKLQALCYKHEIEKTLRTPDYAGFQLLGLNDYSGQGTALVGLLNVFWEEKGYIDAASFRKFCNTTVPLLRVPKFVYKNNETITGLVEISHFGKDPINNPQISCVIRDEFGVVLFTETLNPQLLEIGANNLCGEFSYSLSGINNPSKLTCEISVNGTDFKNDWDFWVYPSELSIEKGLVYETDTLDAQAIEILNNGGNVLIHAGNNVSFGEEIKQYFTPVFWNTSWFKMRPPHTTGLFMNDYHPVFKDFPTSYHSDLQWWELINKTPCIQFTEFPDDFQPLVQSIDTWFLSRKAGVLFEANVLNGKIIMTTLDLRSKPDERIVAHQLYNSILNYMNSDYFRPQFEIDSQLIQNLFIKKAGDIKVFTNDAPDEIKLEKNKKIVM